MYIDCRCPIVSFPNLPPFFTCFFASIEPLWCRGKDVNFFFFQNSILCLGELDCIAFSQLYISQTFFSYDSHFSRKTTITVLIGKNPRVHDWKGIFKTIPAYFVFSSVLTQLFSHNNTFLAQSLKILYNVHTLYDLSTSTWANPCLCLVWSWFCCISFCIFAKARYDVWECFAHVPSFCAGGWGGGAAWEGGATRNMLMAESGETQQYMYVHTQLSLQICGNTTTYFCNKLYF